ncbi:ABC transporter ATP-binding protein [Pseudomonadota bacterium]
MNMISVKNLHKNFGSNTAVDDLSFAIKKGEIVGFLGPNGAGKTTTMRLLTGFLSPDAGEIKIAGKDIATNLHHIQRRIGYLPENNPLYKEMLVQEILDLAADLKSIPTSKRKEAFEFVVDAVSIDDVFYRPITELSKGYKQRVGMALALLHRPDILIMDEPTEGLDPNQRTEIRALIKELAKDRTIILSTHVMGEAAAVASRLLIINRGSLVADGTPTELTRSGQDERVLNLQLEGTHISTELKKLKGVKDTQIEKISGQKYQVHIIYDKAFQIQPELTKLAGRNKWTIWRLAEPESNLEDIFHKLTTKPKP